jgi:hypothetical protein
MTRSGCSPSPDIITSEDAERCRQLAWEVSFLEQR